MGPKIGVALTLLLAGIAANVAVARPELHQVMTFDVVLSGKAEVTSTAILGLAGDMDGSGRLRLTVYPSSKRICYDFTLDKLGTPLMAHIHKAPAQRNGPSVVTLFTGPGGELANCMIWTEKWLARIVANPSEFYVNLYTTEFPDGAVRGQLVS